MTKVVCKKTGKVSHRSKRIAVIVQKNVEYGELMNTYRCGHCRGWHLGHTNNALRYSDQIGNLLKRHEERLVARSKPANGLNEQKSSDRTNAEDH